VKDALKQAAEALSIAVPDLQTGKSFEAVVLFKAALALANGFEELVVRDHRGEVTTTFRLRGGPGHVPSQTAPGDQPSYLELRGSDARRSFELHNSLEFAGASGTEHEIDVALVWKPAIDELRNAGGGIVPHPPLVGIELKEFDPTKSLDKNLLRAFVACVVDLMPLRHLASFEVGRQFPHKEVRIGHGGHMFLYLTTADITPPSCRLCEFFGIEPHPNVDTTKLDQILGELYFRLTVWMASSL
jgi:hypothetical protein